MSTELLTKLGQKLDERQHVLATLDAYMEGRQPLTYLAPAAREALGNRLQQVAVNIPRVVVASVSERLRVTGFVRDGTPDPDLWATWLRQDLDQLSATAHRESLALGASYAVVWAGRDGRAQVSIESPRQVTVARDPATREVAAALKKWEVDDGRGQVAVLYLPDRIIRYTTNAPGQPASGLWTVAESLRNPLSTVPVVPLVNSERLLDTEGRSEFTDAIPLTDLLTKTLTDMAVSSEYFARPRRYATGLEMEERPILDAYGNATGKVETVNPIDESIRMMVSESAETKFGQLASADLGSYEAAVRVIMAQLVAVTGLPEHQLGVGSDNPTSADAIRASEASLTAKAEAKQRLFGRSWERVARLAVAVETGTDPEQLDVRVTWADPSTRSVAQEADAVSKLVAAGILPVTYALAKLGYTADEVTEIRTARRTEALDGAGVQLERLLP